MQIIIDTTTDSTAQIRLAAEFAQRLAALDSTTATDARQTIDEYDRPDVGAPETVRVTAPAILVDVPTAAQAFGTSVPVPPPVPPVDSAPSAATVPTGAAGVDLDTDGLPWDARIHASTRGKNKDGRWTAKRNLNDGAFVARVQAELRSVLAIPVPVPPAMITDAAATQGLPTAVSVPVPPVPTPVPPVPVAVPPVPVVDAGGATSTAAPTDFASLMAVVGPHLSSQKVTVSHLADAARALGLPDFPSLNNRPDLVPTFFQTLRGLASI